jgi:hypothetical protein
MDMLEVTCDRMVMMRSDVVIRMIQICYFVPIQFNVLLLNNSYLLYVGCTCMNKFNIRYTQYTDPSVQSDCVVL